MITESTLARRIVLAAEQPALADNARQFLAAMLPDLDITPTDLESFTESLQEPDTGEDVLVLAMHADADGHLDSGSPLVQQLMNSRVPVLVLRDQPGEYAPIQRIVVPLDGSTTAGQAIPLASRLARRYNLPVKFVMVIDPARVIPPAYAYDPEAWGVIEELRLTAHWALCQAEKSMQAYGVDVSSDLLLGSINASLVASIQEGDLVVMTTHGLDRHNLRYRDSVAKRVLVSIPQPILIMQAESEKPLVIEGYQACGWAEPFRNHQAQTA